MVRPFAVIGFTVFVALSLIFTNEKAAILLLVAAIAAFTISMCCPKMRREFLVPTVAMSVVLAVLLSMGALSEPKRIEELLDSKKVFVQARIIENETKNQNGYYNTVETVKIGNADYKVKIKLRSEKSLKAEPYDLVEGRMTLRSTLKNELSKNYYLSKRLYLKAGAGKDLKIIKPSEKPFNFYILKLQQDINKTLSETLPHDEAGLSKALLIGDKSSLNEQIKEDFSNIGIAHMTAVSGLHLSLWCFFFLKILEKLGVKGKIPYLLSAVFVLLYMAITGFTHSVCRAGIMLLIMIIGKLISLRVDAINSLGFVLVLMCLINPFCVLGVGLQLSLLATLGLILGYKAFKPPYRENYKDRSKIRAYINRFYNYLLGIVMSTVFACVFTMPVTVINFKKIPLFMLNANMLLSFPAVVCMLSAGFLVIFSKISFLSFFIPILKFTASSSACFIIKIARGISSFKYSYIKTNDRIFYAFLYIISAVLLISCIIKFLHRKFNFKIPIAVCAVIFAVFCAVSLADEMMKVTLTVCDVGNGSAVVLENRRETALIGCGGTSFNGADKIKAQIDKSGSDRIKLLYVPRESKSESEYLDDILIYKPVENIVTGTKNNMLLNEFPDLKYTVSAKSDINLWKNVVLKCYTSYDESYSVLKVNGKKVYLNFLPSAPITETDSDILVCREKIPRNTDLSKIRLAVVSADYKKGIYAQRKYKKAVATASQGNIKIEIYNNGKIRAERVN